MIRILTATMILTISILGRVPALGPVSDLMISDSGGVFAGDSTAGAGDFFGDRL